jgi:5-methylcytosine-specific restriction endonuclease McrA
MIDEEMRAAHKHSSRNREEIKSSVLCGCFYCRQTFSADEVDEWTDDNDTALCPKCGIDSVLGDRSGLPVSELAFLNAMQRHFFIAGR